MTLSKYQFWTDFSSKISLSAPSHRRVTAFFDAQAAFRVLE
jgi:hypothetical protein